MTNTYLILTKAKWESALPAKLKKADRLSWNEYTYRDEERSATRMVDKYDYYPSNDNTKAEIKAYMDDCDVDYLSSDTKVELLEKLMIEPHSVPQEEETYTYTEQVVHKFAEEAIYKYIIHAIMNTRANTPEFQIARYKKELRAAKRNAKIRLSNIKVAELAQIMRNQSKWIKH